MQVSVIISTWNNCERLRRTLETFVSLQVQACIHWELVLVNNNCTDQTDTVVEAFAERLPLVYVHEPKPGVSHGRNAGLAQASGRLVLFTDDDVRPAPNWIDAHWNAFEAQPSGYFFGGPVQSEYEGEPPTPALHRIAPPSVVGLDLGEAAGLQTHPAPFVSANWSCEASVLREVGTFNPKLGLNPSSTNVGVGEESELMHRLNDHGLRPWYLPEARLRHMVPADKCTREQHCRPAHGTVSQ